MIPQRSMLSLTHGSVFTRIILDQKSKTSRVDVAMSEDQNGAEDWLGKEIEDTVEDSLAIRGDKVTTLAQTPRNWVESPEERCERASHKEDGADILAESAGIPACLPDENVKDVEKSEHAECPVSPFVRSLHKRSDQASYDHNLVNENNVEDRRPWHASGEEQVHEKKRGGDEPIDVANIEDFAIHATDTISGADELDIDWRPAEIRGHGEVCDRGDHRDSGGDVVEETVGTRLRRRQTDEGEGSAGHHGGDRPVPVGAMGGDSDHDMFAVLRVGYEAKNISVSSSPSEVPKR